MSAVEQVVRAVHLSIFLLLLPIFYNVSCRTSRKHSTSIYLSISLTYLSKCQLFHKLYTQYIYQSFYYCYLSFKMSVVPKIVHKVHLSIFLLLLPIFHNVSCSISRTHSTFIYLSITLTYLS